MPQHHKDWASAPIRDIAFVKGGKRLPKGEKLSDTPTPFPYIRVTDFKNFGVRLSDIKYLQPQTHESIKRYTISANDVYISIAGTIGLTGRVPHELEGANLTENAAKIVIKTNDVDAAFVMFYLASDLAQREIQSQTVKNAQPKLALTRIESLAIPLPPLPEQRRIAHVLSTVQTAIEQQARLIALTRELKAALMRKLFTEGLRGEKQKETEIGLVPESWRVSPLDELLTLTQYGLSVRGADSGDYGILRMTNQKEGKITTDKMQFVTISKDDFEKYQLQYGDILFNRTNSLELVGRTAIFDIKADCVFASYLIRLKTDEKRLNPFYLNHYLNWDESQRRLKSIALRAVSQSNISATRLRTFQVPLPTREEQIEINGCIDTVIEKTEIHRRKKEKLEELFRTLLHQLMTGQTRVNEIELPGLS